MTEVEMLRANAVGYVWGLQDGGDKSGHVVEITADWYFAEAYEEHAQAFADGKATSRMAIQQAWSSWRRHGLIFSTWYQFEPAEYVH